jgi:hypothetical protein
MHPLPCPASRALASASAARLAANAPALPQTLPAPLASFGARLDPQPRRPPRPCAENDAKAGIDRAVSGDQFGSTYMATQNGYRDADATTYPEDNAGQFW